MKAFGSLNRAAATANMIYGLDPQLGKTITEAAD
jgi:hypothetical protein